ncbi:RNA polymerase sigma factor [Hoeflea sp. TYP-13]|uniref:RNA polymerase sigma factor n=1 Tax=Hoeflea sp. TYP-13 TaxID=3230023 RepID=UPI0034C650E9
MARGTKKIIESYLVASARLGNQAARAQLVARYQKRFLRHAYRLLGDTEQAKDAVQDGWVEIMRGLSKLNDDTAFPAWAFRIITRRCGRIISERQKARAISTGVACEPPIRCEASDTMELAADVAPLRTALSTLSPEHRSAVALFYLEEMSVAEVAVALDVPVGTVKSRLLNARAKLRESLERKS